MIMMRVLKVYHNRIFINENFVNKVYFNEWKIYEENY